MYFSVRNKTLHSLQKLPAPPSFVSEICTCTENAQSFFNDTIIQHTHEEQERKKERLREEEKESEKEKLIVSKRARKKESAREKE